MFFEPAAIQDVEITSPFWSRIQQCCREKTLPSIVETQKALDHWTCLTWREGHDRKPHPFWDSDIYKIVEAACYFLMKDPDEKMMASVEEAVDMIRKAQHPDGYINSYYTVHGINRRWTNVRDMHELYCLGHLFEATTAYEQLTGSGRLLEVAAKAIDHVRSVFGPGRSQKRGYPGHQEIEIGLIRLYELTGNVPALDLARYFITERGRRDSEGEIYYDKEAKARGADPYDEMGAEHRFHYAGARDYGYHQADCPLIEANEVKGHSVRAMYFYTAATDLVRLSPPSDLDASKIHMALDRLWRDLVDRKMYVTGGIGSQRYNEGFGRPYLLPDLEAEGCYAETCATFALINWCQRLLRLKLDNEYSNVMELCLYNGFLGALSAEGDAFYYQNVLRTLTGQFKERSKWFGVACCPPNVAKLLGCLGSLTYSTSPDKGLVAVHLYIGSTFNVPGTSTIIHQEADIPRTGKVSITVQGTADLALRIPGWAPSYTCSAQGQVKDGYVYLSAVKDATIQLNFVLSPQKVYADPRTGKDEICIVRGPLVYCVEDVDNESIDIDTIALTDESVVDAPLMNIASARDIIPVTTKCKELVPRSPTGLYGSKPWQYSEEEKEIVAVPFFLRANRPGNGAMRVWVKRLSPVDVTK